MLLPEALNSKDIILCYYSEEDAEKEEHNQTGIGIVRNASDVKGGVRASTRRNYRFPGKGIKQRSCVILLTTRFHQCPSS